MKQKLFARLLFKVRTRVRRNYTRPVKRNGAKQLPTTIVISFVLAALGGTVPPFEKKRGEEFLFTFLRGMVNHVFKFVLTDSCLFLPGAVGLSRLICSNLPRHIDRTFLPSAHFAGVDVWLL